MTIENPLILFKNGVDKLTVEIRWKFDIAFNL